MTMDNLINLIAAILVGGGTITLAVMTWKAVGQTRAIQKSERRERLLNEIIEWAVDILKFSPMPKQAIFALKLKKEEPKVEDVIMLWQVSLSEFLLPIISKGAYINRISETLGKNMCAATNKASLCLGNIIEYINKLEATYSSLEALTKPNEELHNAAVQIIEEATKIKTIDMGKKEENMSKEGEVTASNAPTIKDIEEHLRWQDKKLEDGTYFSGYLFGATLIFIAFGLLAGKYILTTELWYVTYCIVLVIGGTGLTGFAWYKRSKPPK